MTIPKAADFLRISDDAFRARLRRESDLAAAVLDESGGQTYLKIPALMRWLENQRQPAAETPTGRKLRRIV